MRRPTFDLLLVIFLLLLVACCDNDKSSRPLPNASLVLTADTKVPPEFGGPGFKGIGWDCNSEGELYGSPDAVKGGTIKFPMPGPVTSFRFMGKGSATRFHNIMSGLLYESLLSLHPNSMEWIPSLASHWQILRDHRTFRFRINSKARWADGKPVTTKDVIASWAFNLDPGLADPYTNQLCRKFKKPIAESPYILHVTARELNWQLFLFFASMQIYPAHVLEKLDGKTYMKRYEDEVMPGTGPYSLQIVDKDHIRFIRRPDYWAKNERLNQGVNNFDCIEMIAETRDKERSFADFRQSKFDVYAVYVSRQWVKETDFPEIKRGLIQKRKIFNKAPQGFYGLAFNMRKPPLDDIRMRKALVYLFNRQKLIKQYYFNEYTPLDSYYPGSVYADPKNPIYRYDESKAAKLLAEAGWKKNDGGWLAKDGKILEVTFLGHPSMAVTFKHYQEDLRKAGIKLKMDLRKQGISATIMSHNFEIAYQGWTQSMFPDLESAWSSSLADKLNTFNICGVKLAKIDRICEVYRRMFMQRQRVEAIREIDHLLMNHNPYALMWGKNYERILYWNKFGHTPGYITKTGDYWSILHLWWIDKGKKGRLQQALKDKSISMKIGETQQRYWLDKK